MKYLSLALLCALAFPAAAQTPAEAVRDTTEHAHLVGHEDAALLKRIEDALSEWDPRNLTSPYLKEISTKDGKKFVLRRPDLAEFIADPDAAVALGKALFWDMQAGSDYHPGFFGLIQHGGKLLGDFTLKADAGSGRPELSLNDLKVKMPDGKEVALGDVEPADLNAGSGTVMGDLLLGGKALKEIELTARWKVAGQDKSEIIPFSKVPLTGTDSLASVKLADLEGLFQPAITPVKVLPRASGTACASCHYRFGADARNKNTEAIAFQAWNAFVTDYGLTGPNPDTRVERPPFSQRNLAFAPNGEINAAKFGVPASPTVPPGLLQHEITGSQGIVLRNYTGTSSGGVETFSPVPVPAMNRQPADMFVEGTTRTRQVTRRNSPSIINAVFNDRQFHDGRAESTFNGYSVFGDFDKRVVLRKAFLDASLKATRYEPVSIAITNASLASQAVGPVVNEVEMSYLGRNFHDIAVKMLRRQALRSQAVSTTDSVLAPYAKPSARGLYVPGTPRQIMTYRELIKRAFRKEWWADNLSVAAQSPLASRIAPLKSRVAALNNALPAAPAGPVTTLRSTLSAILADNNSLPAHRALAAFNPPPAGAATQALHNAVREWNEVELEILPLRADPAAPRTTVDPVLAAANSGAPCNMTAQDDLMVQNFSLYWGLAIMLYESTLISNQTPFDQMMRGDATGVNNVWNGGTGQTITTLVTAGGNPAPPPNNATPPEPPGDDTIRRAQLDKLTTLNGPPVLTGTAMFQRGFRVFVRNCAECHAPPFFTSAANMPLDPAQPDPIAKIHAHSLVRTALADAFKARLAEAGHPPPAGVSDANRHLLGGRRWFFDQERIPVLEQTVAELMIELMGIPATRPVSFNTAPPFPGAPDPDRNPMITWTGTRPPLGFAPSPQPGAPPLDPYAFYDVGYYNVGVSEPRYDWGVWAYERLDEVFSEEAIMGALRAAGVLSDAPDPLLPTDANGIRKFKPALLNAGKLSELRITEVAIETELQRTAAVPGQLPLRASTRGSDGLPGLGSAYRLPRRGRLAAAGDETNRAIKMLQFRSRHLFNAPAGAVLADHSADREYLPELDEDGNPLKRKDHHFFKRARRMVMTEETWGHRKPFINDNELMGWGAFKTPGLRNIALTEPYMHNGRFLTLRQVLQFYSFDNTRLIPAHAALNPDLHPEMGRLDLNADGLTNGLNPAAPGGALNLTQIQDAESLLFFLHCLTDDRVLRAAGPFDHPEIRLPNGYQNGNPAAENFVVVAPVGTAGRTPPAQFPSDR